MDAASLLHIFGMAMLVTLKVTAPILIAAVVIGLAISLFQALTQINESTLAFLPKLVVMVVMVWLTLPWIVQELVGFTVQVFSMAAEASK